MAEETKHIFVVEPASQAGGMEIYDGGYAFGPFALFPSRQILLENDVEVKLGGRALTLLSALLDRAGDVVPKDELVRLAWPTTQVEEGNLRVHIAAIRRALHAEPDGIEYISNVIGRGYQFVAPVRRISANVPYKQPSIPSAPVIPGLPSPLTRVLGRGDAISGIVQLINRQRLVSVVGPGGIGKTTIALVAAQQVADSFSDGIFFVDLASLSDAHHVPLAVAAALNFSVETDVPLMSLVSHLKHRRALIILDNCEHVVGAAASVVEALLKGASGLRILTTSHEPLRAEGEWLFRLQPLELPQEGRQLTFEEAVSYPSIELFFERATSDNQELRFGNVDVPFLIEICRKLDGIPLAIEIAAAQVEVFGVAGLADRLDQRLDVLTGGRRTAVGRHQTMRNMLDWSHDNLTPSERVVLRRLAIFASAFSIDAAEMVCGDEHLSPSKITEGIASLVRKSLLYPKRGERSVSYRLLESTRLYALEKLDEAGELSRMRLLHLQFTIDMLERADAEWKDVARNVWLSRYSPLLAEVRFALGWVFLPGGEPGAGVRLTAVAMPLGLQLGLVDEFRERAETALSHARNLTPPELVSEMRINIVYGILNQNQIQPNDHNIGGLTRAAHLADEIGADRYRLEPEIVLAAFNMGMGDYDKSISHAERAEELGKSTCDDLAVLASHRILSQVTHFNGEHRRAATLAKSVLAHPITNIPTAFGSVQTDRRVSMRIVLARTFWMQGGADQAVSMLNEATEIARDDGPLALCQALALASCPILLWRGDDKAAHAAVETLLEQSSRFTLRHWHSWGRLFESVIKQRLTCKTYQREDLKPEGGLQIQTLATFNSQLVGLDDGGVADNGWCGPEILRARGEQIAQTNDLAAAEDIFKQTISLAQRQEALAWELRGVMSLARLWQRTGREQAAGTALNEVYGRFSEGFDTTDLVDARKLLGELGQR